MLTLPKRATKPTTLSPSILPGRSSDLDMILNIAADNEAEKIIVALQLPQMVRVLSALAKKQRRSTPLLRSIAYNISSHKKILNLKECSDVLYAMTKLSFYDIILLTRVSTDTQLLLKQNKQAAPVGSIITSLGHLRYRDTGTTVDSYSVHTFRKDSLTLCWTRFHRSFSSIGSFFFQIF